MNSSPFRHATDPDGVSADSLRKFSASFLSLIALVLGLVAAADLLARWTGPGSTADEAILRSLRSASIVADRADFSGDPDVDFVRAATAQAQVASNLAQIELRYGRDAGLLRLAQQMVARQRSELDQLRSALPTQRTPGRLLPPSTSD